MTVADRTSTPASNSIPALAAALCAALMMGCSNPSEGPALEDPSATDGPADDPGSSGEPFLDPEQETEEVSQVGDDEWLAYTDIVIEASPEEVWEVLTDFESMSGWSSSLQNIEGELVDGADVLVTFSIFGMTFELDHVLIWVEGEQYGWSDPVLGFDGVTDRHLYVVAETDGTHTLFIQEDTYTGTSEAATAQDLAEMTAPVYSSFNRELKAEVEARFGK